MSASTVNVNNSRGQSIDTIWTPAGEKRVKLAVGSATISGDSEVASWQGVATHEDGATFVAGDGVSLAAGLNGTTVQPVSVDDEGRIAVGSGGTLTDAAATSITSGGNDQEMFAANPSRRYLLIQNLDSSEALWINFGAAAAQDNPSIRLAGYQLVEFSGNFIPTQSVHVIATTTSHKFAAKEG